MPSENYIELPYDYGYPTNSSGEVNGPDGETSAPENAGYSFGGILDAAFEFGGKALTTYQDYQRAHEMDSARRDRERISEANAVAQVQTSSARTWLIIGGVAVLVLAVAYKIFKGK